MRFKNWFRFKRVPARRISEVGEDQQAALLSAISDAVCAVDMDGLPIFFNSRFAVLFDGIEFQTRHIWKVIQDSKILDAYQLALKEGVVSSVGATSLRQGNTGKQFFSVSVSPLRNRAGNIYGAMGIFHDVTDLKRAEQIRIDFVANVSHELRTPLTAIKGYADTLIADAEQGRPIEKDFLQVITRHTDRLMSLIHDLLDLSTIESTDVIHKSPLGTQEMTERVLKQLENPLSAKRQKISAHYEATSVLADPRRLEQVLINLLDNASKYTPSDGKISIWWEVGPSMVSGQESVQLKVTDTGPGIPIEHHARLFERFYRVDKARSREQGGTGLGLAIVKHIMQRHGGMIWVESRAGEGSTFICQFPA